MNSSIGFVGWRGMVGSVLLQRLVESGFSEKHEIHLFSGSQVGQVAPDVSASATLLDAMNLETLMECTVIVSCQGSAYTNQIHPQLRAKGWTGFWIDAASALRMRNESVIILDPINGAETSRRIEDGARDLIGGNCTVSLMLLAIGGLIRSGEVEWVSSMTYQAASGAGAQQMKELIDGMGVLYHASQQHQSTLGHTLLQLEQRVTAAQRDAEFPQQAIGAPLAGSLLPWIDSALDSGQSREEWKGQVEANKILGYENQLLKVDGTCVRVGALRCHSQGLTIKLKRPLAVETVESFIRETSDWTKLIPNTKEDTLTELTPVAISGTRNIAVGRVRPMTLGPDFLNVFTVGDQLLWGAAEPLLCALERLSRMGLV